MIRAIALSQGHYECRSLKETISVLTDLLAFEVVKITPGRAVVRHLNTQWLLVLHEAGPTAADKPQPNHYGVRVASRGEVDVAWEYITAHRDAYRIDRITRPTEPEFYSFYFREPGGNHWEIEWYDPALVAQGRSIAAPPWAALLPEERFPGKGYIPQALTHGSLECDDKASSEHFYRGVLGLGTAGGSRKTSLHVKHPADPWYIVVVASGRRRQPLPPACRFTLQVASPDEVRAAHREFASRGSSLGIAELREIRQEGRQFSFIFSDLDRNWWEVAATVS
ncbi:MAG: VOC family protein [Deltaproteobacteria bacterium]|nr:VOC family protein [Deltaproteobacteria bacterium]